MTRAIQHLQDALARADLHTPPYPDALQRLTDVVVQGREYYVFWNHAEWVRMIDARTETADLPLPSFYGQTLETFFLNGQKAGAFRIDIAGPVAGAGLRLPAVRGDGRGAARRIAPLGMKRHGAETVPGRATDVRG